MMRHFGPAAFVAVLVASVHSASATVDPCGTNQTATFTSALQALANAWENDLACGGAFPPELVDYWLGPDDDNEFCIVILSRINGDIVVFVDPDTADPDDKYDIYMVGENEGDLEELDDTFCTSVELIGESKLSRNLTQQELQFAVLSVNAERVNGSCTGGKNLTMTALPDGTYYSNAKIQKLVYGRDEVSWTMRLTDGTSTYQLEVGLEVTSKWYSDTNISRSFMWLYAEPESCDITPLTRRLPEMPREEFKSFRVDENWHVISQVRRRLDGDLTADSKKFVAWAKAKLGITSFPAEWDFRKAVPSCVAQPRSQDTCGSCWAFTVLGALEKQICYLSNGATKVDLSRQRQLECDTESFACDGGYPREASKTLIAKGAVAEGCQPYSSGPSGDPKAKPAADNAKCFASYTTAGACTNTMYMGRLPTTDEQSAAWILGVTDGSNSAEGVPGSNMLKGEEAMMAGIILYGAIHSSYDCCADFQAYSGGVFVSTSKQDCGGHAVHVIGWGVDAATHTNYWIVENSWGNRWGENQTNQPCSVQVCQGDFCKRDPNSGEAQLQDGEQCGYFRIKKGTNEANFEVGAGHHYAAGATTPPQWLVDAVQAAVSSSGAAVVKNNTVTPASISKPPPTTTPPPTTAAPLVTAPPTAGGTTTTLNNSRPQTSGASRLASSVAFAAPALAAAVAAGARV